VQQRCSVKQAGKRYMAHISCIDGLCNNRFRAVYLQRVSPLSEDRYGTLYSNILRDSYGELGKYVGSWVRRVLLNKQNYDHT